EGIKILQKEKNITIIHDDTSTVGTTGSHAFGDNVRPKEILQNLFGLFSRKKESITLYSTEYFFFNIFQHLFHFLYLYQV
ncbi:MAG: hypothetical protein KGD57_01120, partial [Candidatus Lokiarchaeota archaeon]|nr:hypothetical protein [Candidatus Lokiarchaeota archaeon]